MGVPCFNAENEQSSRNKEGKNIILRLKKPLTPAATRVPRVKLSNGVEIPAFGLGTWRAKPKEVFQAVKDAIDAGYRHFDCALTHLNESEVGAAIRAKIEEGVVKREEVFVVSKLWNTFHRPDLVEVALQKSLKALGLEYLDLFLIQWPTAFKEGSDDFCPRDSNGRVIFSDVDFCETWKAMEELVHKGLVRSIGVSNFNEEQLERLLVNATIKPVLNQIEVHPYLTNRNLVEYCKVRNVEVTSYSSLKSPDRLWEHEPALLQDPRLMELARKYNKTVAQVILRWLIQRGIIVIPKSVNKDRIIENYNIFDFYLSESDMEAIFSLNRNRRTNSFHELALGHKEYPFRPPYYTH